MVCILVFGKDFGDIIVADDQESFGILLPVSGEYLSSKVCWRKEQPLLLPLVLFGNNAVGIKALTIQNKLKGKDENQKTDAGHCPYEPPHRAQFI